MPLAYKDIKALSYYQGDLSFGYGTLRQVFRGFLFVEQITPSGIPGRVGIVGTAVNLLRPPNQRGWVQHLVSGPEDDDTWLFPATVVEIQLEGLPLAPGDPQQKASTTCAVTPPSKHLRPDGTPKRRIPENVDLKVCAVCHAENKPVVLFRTTGYWCPTCEP